MIFELFSSKRTKAAKRLAEQIELLHNCPLLDPVWYRKTYSDLRAPTDIARHYLEHGAAEGRNPGPLFDTKYYLEQNPDLAILGHNPLVHFIVCGAAAGRDPHPLFHTKFYLSQGPDCRGLDPASHYVKSGWKEWLRPNELFDPKRYFSSDEQLRRAGFEALCRLLLSQGDARNKTKNANEQLTLSAPPLRTGTEVRVRGTLQNSVSLVERTFGREFSEPAPPNRQFFPLESAAQGTVYEQYFIPDNPSLESITIFFYTYLKKNGASLTVTLFLIGDDQDTLILVRSISKDDILDARPHPIWLEQPITNANNCVFRLVVSVDSLEPGSSFTVAGMIPHYRGICLTPHPNAASIGLALEFNTAPPPNSSKMFAFISGCPGDAFRYRCVHQAEALTRLGYSVDIFQPGNLPYKQLIQNYSIVVVHRVPHDEDFEQFIDEARKSNIIVTYDTDDLIFDPSLINQIDGYKYLDKNEQDLFVNGLFRYRKAISLCEFVTVTTERLYTEINKLWPEKRVSIMRNCVSEAMLQNAISAPREEKSTTENVRLAYFSGTKTHQKDFAQCIDALIQILSTNPFVQVVIVGHLDVPFELERFGDRLQLIPFMAWEKLPEVYSGIDINLAPLEPRNAFTESKSELKYLEAALLKVPTVASRVGAYSKIIRNWSTGVLCRDRNEWIIALERLINDKQLRERIGIAAFNDVIENSSTFGACLQLGEAWRGLLKDHSLCNKPDKRNLSIAFVTRAPIAITGGGYKKIFLLANYLIERGYDVRVHVEQIAHLEGKSDKYIRAFCNEHFGISESSIFIGHDTIGPVDFAIATNWPTAPTVAGLHNARAKAYFVQDFEPSFYAEDSKEYELAAATYNLPLSMVTIGDYLARRLAGRGRAISSVPFSIDDVFHQAGRKRRNERAAASNNKRCSILFFARPNIPRRNFAAGVEGLTLLSRKFGDQVAIELYGLDEQIPLPFQYKNLGQLSQDELAVHMANADIHLSFSLTNISTVIYEAMACGCACVEANVGPVQAMVQHNVHCVLAVPDGAGTFAALDGLVLNPEFRRDLARRGQEHAAALTANAMAVAFEKLIDDGWLGAR